MSDFLTGLFSYGFFLRALVVGVMVSLCAALLGVTLTLKKFSMIGDGLSHVGFGAMTVALAMNLAPLWIAIPVMFLAAFLLLRLEENSRVNHDAAIAIISSGAIAVGITAASLAGGMNTDVYGYMFGSILAVTKSDVILALTLGGAMLIAFLLCYHRVFAVTFDEEFSSATGVKTNVFNFLFAMLTAAVILVGMRIVGTMLISGLIIFPAVTAMRLFRSFKKVTIASAVISVTAFLLGMLASYAFAYIPAGAGVVLVNLVFLGIACLIGKKD